MLQFVADHTVWAGPGGRAQHWEVGCPADVRAELRPLGEAQGEGAADHVVCPGCGRGLATVGWLRDQRVSGLVNA